MKKLFLIIFSVLVVQLVALPTTDFQKWVVKRTAELDEKGNTVQTALGPLQYVWKGKKSNPVVVVLHGAFGGWDQSLLIAEHLLDRGFSVIAVSRPGYLGSPLGAPFPPGISNEVQADVIKTLLDALRIDKAALLGFSAGAPVAFLVAQKYPERVWGLVLECIGANIPQDIPMYALIELLFATGDPEEMDFGTYMLYLSMKKDFYSVAKDVLSDDNNLTTGELNQRIAWVMSHHSQSKFLVKFLKSVMPLSPRIPGIQNDVANIGQFPTFNYTGFSVPTIIVQAINDTNGNFPTAEFVNAQINAQQAGLSQLIAVRGSGHFVWLGKFTKQWENTVETFLQMLAPKKTK